MNEITPCGVMFRIMKHHYKMSYQELAGLVLSDNPMLNGRAPSSKISDRTWVSRFIVNAPASSLRTEMFCDYATATMRILARIKTRTKNPLDSAEIYELLESKGHPMMQEAISNMKQEPQLYQNVLSRICNEKNCTLSERVEFSMILFVSTGCSLDVRKAAEYTINYANSIHGSKMKTTPSAEAEIKKTEIEESDIQIGLLRIVDGYVKGETKWISPDPEGSTIGYLALGDNDINDVDSDVSSKHVRIYKEDAKWWIEDLESKNGTIHINGLDRKKTKVDSSSNKVELHAGDEVLLAKSTRYAVIEGFTSR